MKKNKFLNFVLSASLLSFSFSCSENISQEQLSIQENNIESFAKSERKYNVSFTLKDKNTILDLLSEGIDLHGSGKNGKFSAYISDKQAEILKSKKISIVSKNSTNDSTRGLPTGYHTVQEVLETVRDYAKKYPELAKLQDIGDSWEKTQGKANNNDVWCLSISNKNKKNTKPASLFIGGMHSRELAPPEIMFKLAQTLVNEYGKDPLVTEIVDTRDVNIVPMVNVDGRIQVEKGNNWQRKNTHGKGVDLNRNFDSHWNYQGLNVPSHWVGDAANPSSETYSGTAPASEPEVQAIQNFYKVKKLNMVLDMHSYGEMFFWPVGYSEDDVPEAAVFKDMYNNSFKKIGYSGGTSMSLLYPTTGTTDDYAYVKHHAMGLGMEVGQSFRPSYQEVETMWSKLKPNLLYLLKISNKTL